MTDYAVVEWCHPDTGIVLTERTPAQCGAFFVALAETPGAFLIDATHFGIRGVTPEALADAHAILAAARSAAEIPATSCLHSYPCDCDTIAYELAGQD